MPMQTGIGFSKVIILLGVGYTSTLLVKNGKLADLLGELQSLVKGVEKKGDSSNNDPDFSDGIAAQVRRLAMEVQQLASAHQITVLNGNSVQGRITSLVVPAAVLGALGYGYVWWKGLSFSDLMYVTKHNMANAVSKLTKHLEHVSDTLSATKRHLTQRVENLDGKLDEQVEISKLIKNDVSDVHGDLSQIGDDLDALHRILSGLDSKILSLEDKQDLTNIGLYHLISFADGRKVKMPNVLQEQVRLVGRSRGHLEMPSRKGLLELADSLEQETVNWSTTDGSLQDRIDKLDDSRRSLVRTASLKC